MTHRTMTRWERTLRKMALNLAIGLNNIYGSIGGTIYRVPDPLPQRDSAPPPDDLAPTFVPSAPNLPQREHRGRD